MLEKNFSLFQKKGKRKKKSSKESYFSLSDTSERFKKRKKSYIKTYVYKMKPYFTRQNRVIIFGSGIIFLIIFILFLIFGPFLKVQNILITREDNIININQAYGNIEYIRGKNLFFLDTSDIVTRLQKGQNSIEEVRFNIGFPNSLQIHLKGYPAIFHTQDQLILKNGAFITKEGVETYDLPLLIIHSSDEDIFMYGRMLQAGDLQKIKILITEIEKNIAGFKVSSIQFYTAEKEVIISNSDKTLFIFDINGNIKKQIEQLSIYQKEGGNLKENTYVYIDVRVLQKIFLCPYEQEFNCVRNMKNIYGEDIFTSIPPDLNEVPSQ